MALTDNEKALVAFVVVGGVALLAAGSASAAVRPAAAAAGGFPPVPTGPVPGGTDYDYGTGGGPYDGSQGSTGYQTEVQPLAPGTGVWTPESATGVATSGGTVGGAAGVARGRADVQRLQEMLADLGYDPGVIDGRFGPDTQRAVDDFGRSVGTRFARGYSQVTANAVGQMWAQGGVGVPAPAPVAKELSSGLGGGWRRY